MIVVYQQECCDFCWHKIIILMIKCFKLQIYRISHIIIGKTWEKEMQYVTSLKWNQQYTYTITCHVHCRKQNLKKTDRKANINFITFHGHDSMVSELIIFHISYCLVRFMVCNATFNNISAISWRSVLLMEETGVHREYHRPVSSHWQALSHYAVSSTPRHERGLNSQL